MGPCFVGCCCYHTGCHQAVVAVVAEATEESGSLVSDADPSHAAADAAADVAGSCDTGPCSVPSDSATVAQDTDRGTVGGHGYPVSSYHGYRLLFATTAGSNPCYSCVDGVPAAGVGSYHGYWGSSGVDSATDCNYN